MKQIHEECGVFGIWSPNEYDVASEAYMALYALQHRGQESCGIAVNRDGVITAHKDVGLVPDVFHRGVLDKLGLGHIAVGHVRYSTTGKPQRSDAQPLVVRHIKGNMVLAHNGALTNAQELREELEMGGAIFHTNNDSEVISYIITSERLRRSSIELAVEGAMHRLKGAYSLVIMSPRKLIAVRDPNGFRPLCMGRMGDKIIFASESCALDSIGASFVRDIEPGEIVVCDNGEIRSIRSHCGGKCNMCVFEYVYNARPDSVIEGISVHEARLKAGAILAQEHPVEADVVIGVPDSGLDAALGYSRESGIPYGVGFIKNRYVGRTFIQPTQSQREKSVRIKLNALAHTVEGKRVILVDDSIVRGTTSARIVSLLREAGAKEVHMRLSSPPFIDVCYFGTDISSKKNLIACQMSVEEIRQKIGADTLGYLSIEGIKKVAERPNCDYCVGCFTGEYPIPVPDTKRKDRFDNAIHEQ